MDLDRVTMTGADDSVHPEKLLDLSQQFPFVEWGILVSKSNMGSNRFPSARWIADIQGIAETTGGLAMSLHVCGRWVRDLLLGELTIPLELLHCFARVQLNFHAERAQCDPRKMIEAMKPLSGKEFIFQIDGAKGNAHLDSYFEYEGGRAFPLFDVSGGAGVLPDAWPAPIYMTDPESYCYHGYAGGLGPQNLARQLPLIATAAGDCRIWIDMETHIRSNSDRNFDLTKVRTCLRVSEPFISRASGSSEGGN